MAEETQYGENGARDALIRGNLRSALDAARQQLAELEGSSRDIGDYLSGVDEPLIVPWELSPAREEQLRQQVAELEEALERLQAGNYGTCESCGQPIDIERLEALPQARLCINCARAQDAH